MTRWVDHEFVANRYSPERCLVQHTEDPCPYSEAEHIKPKVCEDCGYEKDSFACRIRHQHLDLSWTRGIH